MTLSIRNGSLALAFSLLVLVTGAYSVLAALLVAREGWTALVGPLPLWGLLAESGAALAVAAVGSVVVRRAFRKSAEPELFFFTLFLASVAGEALLLWQAWLGWEGLPLWFSGVLTRTVWAFRLTGLFLLFCGSLFSFDFSYRKFGTLFALCGLAATAVAALLPLHTTAARNHVLVAIGDAPGVALVTTLLALVAATNFALGAFRSGTPLAWSRAGAAFFFLSGWALSITVAPWLALLHIPGIVLAVYKADQTTILL